MMAIKLKTFKLIWDSGLNKDKVMLLSILMLDLMEKKNSLESTFKRHFAMELHVFLLEGFLIG